MNWEVSAAPMCRACMEIDGTFVPMDDASSAKKNLLWKLVDLTSVEVCYTFFVKSLEIKFDF